MRDRARAEGASPVADWLGPEFAALHPLLQHLHRHGGTLSGPVHLAFGCGAGGWLGRRLARKMGLPEQAGDQAFEVDIALEGGVLVWTRRFGSAPSAPVVSRFEPVGRWPHGHWRECTGALRLRLTVDVHDGAWHWRVLGARLHGVPIPVALLPRSHAGKWIVDGAYRFEVAFVMPVFGTLLRYGGTLQAAPRGISAAAASPAGSPPPGSGAGGSAG